MTGRSRPAAAALRAVGAAVLLAAAAMAPGGVIAADATADTARAHLGYGPEHPLVQNGWRAFAERLGRAPAASKLELFLNGPAPEDPAAIENLARGDYAFGAASLPAFGRRFPHAALLSELGLAGGDDELAATAAATELLAIDCAPCVDAFRREHVVFLGAYSAARYVLLSAQPATQPEAFRGLSVVTPGSAWDRLVAGLGAVPVDQDGGVGDLFDAGVISAAIATPMDLADPDVWAHAQNVLAAPLGAYRGGGAFLASADYWRSLSLDGRRALMDAAADGLVAVVWGYQNVADAALRDAAARGVAVAAASPALAEAMRALIQQDTQRIAETAVERFGVEDAAAFLDRFLLLYDKFAVLLASAPDAAAAAAVLRKEIFERIDVARYGGKEGG